jgi:CubicO group peptidase (beta-lactamase class C family)
LAFLDAVASSSHEFHSFMMVRHGHVIAEGWWTPYRRDLNHMLYSLSKSFTSTAIGFAVTERKLTVNDPVVSFFPDQLPEQVSENLTALRIKDLLTMSVGHAEDSSPIITKQENWVKAFLALPIPNRPGTVFLYNSGATYMLSAIVQKVSGQKLIDFLQPRLFRPLGIEAITWESCPRGINTGGWGLAVQTEALAKFGQFYLQKGTWNGREILPGSWIEEATTFKIQQPAASEADLERAKRDSEWHQGYCYQFWRCRHNAYRGDGAFGQYTIVMPEQDAVVAITGESGNMAGEMELVWKHLLPAMKAGRLDADTEAQTRLKQRLSSLALIPPVLNADSPLTNRISGKIFKVEANDLKAQTVSFVFRKDACVFTLNDGQKDYPITCGMGKWETGETTMPGTPQRLTVGPTGIKSKVAASGTWKNDNTFEMTWHFFETPHHDTITCSFEGDQVSVEFLSSVPQLMPNRKEKRPVLRGQLA